MILKKLKLVEIPKDLKTNVKTIDQQHMAIISVINHLNICALEGKGREQLINIISFLDKYVKVHFAEEEKYMEKCSYPQIEEHKKQHRIFENYVEELKFKIETGLHKPNFHVKALSFLKNWITNHIINVDMIMAKYLKENFNEI